MIACGEVNDKFDPKVEDKETKFDESNSDFDKLISSTYKIASKVGFGRVNSKVERKR